MRPDEEAVLIDFAGQSLVAQEKRLTLEQDLLRGRRVTEERHPRFQYMLEDSKGVVGRILQSFRIPQHESGGFSESGSAVLLTFFGAHGLRRVDPANGKIHGDGRRLIDPPRLGIIGTKSHKKVFPDTNAGTEKLLKQKGPANPRIDRNGVKRTHSHGFLR